MNIDRRETPDELFRAEVEQPASDAIVVSAVDINFGGVHVPAVRFALGGTNIYHWPEDAKRIAAAIIECAEHGRKK